MSIADPRVIGRVTVISEITMPITVGTSAGLGPQNVTVTSPDGGMVTCIGCFSVDADPMVTSSLVSSLPPGTKSATVIFTVTNFATGAIVSLGSGITALCVTVLGPTQLQVTVKVAKSAVSGPRTVTVSEPDGVREAVQRASR